MIAVLFIYLYPEYGICDFRFAIKSRHCRQFKHSEMLLPVTRQLLSVWLPASQRFLSTDRKQFLTITTASLPRSFTLPPYKINTEDMKKTLTQCVAFCLSVCFQRYSMIQFPYGKHYIQRFKIIKSQQYTTPGFRLRIQEVRSARWIGNTGEWAFW